MEEQKVSEKWNPESLVKIEGTKIFPAVPLSNSQKRYRRQPLSAGQLSTFILLGGLTIGILVGLIRSIPEIEKMSNVNITTPAPSTVVEQTVEITTVYQTVPLLPHVVVPLTTKVRVPPATTHHLYVVPTTPYQAPDPPVTTQPQWHRPVTASSVVPVPSSSPPSTPPTFASPPPSPSNASSSLSSSQSVMQSHR